MIKLKIIDRIPPIMRNKYVLTIIIFLIWIIFFDSNNLISRIREMKELYKLRTDREYYIRRIENDSQKLYELKTDNENLEKFAREQYRMKEPDEDLYIVLTPQEYRQMNRKNN